MTAFDTDFFDTAPPEGLYNVDIGMSDVEDFGHLQAFADMNSDKYTDMISTHKDSNTIIIHTYASMTKMFTFWKTFQVEGCGTIRGITVGRSTQSMRLYITCDHSSSTIVKLVDRVSTSKLSATGMVIEEDYEFNTLPFSLTIETDS